jgi:membrane protease subunit (stomatin/prohibitin family)
VFGSDNGVRGHATAVARAGRRSVAVARGGSLAIAGVAMSDGAFAQLLQAWRPAPVAYPSPAQVAQDTHADANECIVCMERARRCACLPCGHLCLCATCSVALGTAEAPKCPQCRASLTEIKFLFV